MERTTTRGIPQQFYGLPSFIWRKAGYCLKSISLLLTYFVLLLGVSTAWAAVDLVINVDTDKPAYKSTETQTITVTVTNNGPNTATNSLLKVLHPAAGAPFEASATCIPSGGAVCPTSYTGLPSNTLTATIPSLPSQAKVVISFQVIPLLVCRRPQGASPSVNEPCTQGFTYDIGRKTITATVTNSATDGLPITNVANTNIVLYAPTLGYRVVITNAPASALVPGQTYLYEFEVQSQGQDPTGPLQLKLHPESQGGTPTPPASFTSFLPGTEIVSLVCLTSTPAAGAALPNTAIQTAGNACSNTPVAIPTPGPTTVSNDTLRGFPTTDFIEIPGSAIVAGGFARFRAQVKIGTPRCSAIGATDRPLAFNVTVTGANESAPFGISDNVATTTNSVNTSCLEADIQGNLTLIPAAIVATTPGSNSYVMRATISNLSTGSGAGTATNVAFAMNSGAHPFFLGPITVGTPTCVPSGGATCPTSYSTMPTTPATQKTVSGVVPSLPPGSSVDIDVTITAGNTQPICNYSGIGVTIATLETLPDPMLFDPNYNPTTLPNWVNNRDEDPLTITAAGSNPSASGCSGGSPSSTTTVTVAKTGPFATPGSGPAIGQSSGAFLAPGTTVWYRVAIVNIGSVPVDLRQLGDNSSGSSAVGATGGFQGSGSTLGGWSIACSAAGGATCFNTVFTAPSSLQTFVNLGYAGNTTAPLPAGASLTLDLPYVIPAPTLSTPGVCTAQFFNTATAGFDFGGSPAFASSVASPFVYTGYSACATNMNVTKTINPPATTSSIPASGVISYNILLENLATTQAISQPRFIDVPQLNIAGSAMISTMTVGCSVTTGAAVCPPVSSLVVGTQMPSATPIAPNTIDIAWGAPSAPTMPPGSALTFTVTLTLTAPTPAFSGLSNRATLRADNETLYWQAKQSQVSTFVPASPIVSVQKRVATQIIASAGVASYTVDVLNLGATTATNVQYVDNLAPQLAAANPSGYSAVTCTDISATMPTPVGVTSCPTPVGTAAGLNFMIPALPQNTALRFTYSAQMPSIATSVENFVSVTPQTSPGVLTFNAGAAGAHANVQVLAAAAAPNDPPALVPTLSRWLLAVLGMLLFVVAIRSRKQTR
jgi:uncharacterized repeat protein (TIGR01451 family)